MDHLQPEDRDATEEHRDRRVALGDAATEGGHRAREEVVKGAAGVERAAPGEVIARPGGLREGGGVELRQRPAVRVLVVGLERLRGGDVGDVEVAAPLKVRADAEVDRRASPCAAQEATACRSPAASASR